MVHNRDLVNIRRSGSLPDDARNVLVAHEKKKKKR